MMRKALDEEGLGQWLEALLRGPRRVVAPVREGDLVVFRPVTSREEILWDEGKSTLPLKEWLFPPTEPVLHYRFWGNEVEVEDPPLEAPETVVLFARPCDAAALGILDVVFASDYEDAFYLTRRRAMTVVGLSCSRPQPECFCAAVGLSPTATQGSDILLTPLDGRYLVEVLTEKGQRLVEENAALFQEAEGLDKEKATAAALAQMEEVEPLGEVSRRLSERFESEMWEVVARKCVGCGVCAFLCPTCHCFDIVDEANAFGGCRCKNWDACAFALFTLHASGHNPRPTQAHRYRQRVMHKFAYFPENFGPTMCVGCGRCLVHCPVGMDIYEIVRILAGGGAA